MRGFLSFQASVQWEIRKNKKKKLKENERKREIDFIFHSHILLADFAVKSLPLDATTNIRLKVPHLLFLMGEIEKMVVQSREWSTVEASYSASILLFPHTHHTDASWLIPPPSPPSPPLNYMLPSHTHCSIHSSGILLDRSFFFQ